MNVRTHNPWQALFALCLGFFMILLDMTIVSVANPAIERSLPNASLNGIVWVTSAYLLTYAVPLLITGRLGDRFGPKNVYLVGLVVFTVSSLFCGLSGTITQLITARAFQGLGAALMTPQTMAVITRIFPPDKRGTAMGLWGAVAGVATLVGPILGGVLVDNFGWEWIFYVNVPVGIVGFALAWFLVPDLETRQHKFDFVGVVLSAAGLFLLVFGLQEGNTYNWDWRVWTMIVGGIAILIGFVLNQAKTSSEPLVPLGLFKDRNFSLANLAITGMGFAVTGMMLPIMFYAQLVLGYSPTKSALMFAPMALMTLFLAPVIGRIVDKVHPRYIPTFGFAVLAVAMAWFATVQAPGLSYWKLLVPVLLMGLANACIWAPLGATATFNLPPQKAGAGAGIYNTTRQVGSVLGSAAVGALMVARLSAHGIHQSADAHDSAAVLPPPVNGWFSDAMAESLYLPAAILVVGIIASALFIRPTKKAPVSAESAQPASVPVH